MDDEACYRCGDDLDPEESVTTIALGDHSTFKGGMGVAIVCYPCSRALLGWIREGQKEAQHRRNRELRQ